MEIKKDKRRIILSIISLCLILISILAPTLIQVFAEETSGNDPPGTETVINLDNTKVMEDLLSADGFNILNYPFDQSEDKMVVINFIEYCYSYKLDSQDNYALYLYIYNPQGIEIDTTKINKVQMAVEFDEELNPTRYEKFNLEFCDKSQGDYAELFYKFKIENAEYFLGIVNSLERHYYISGIELQVNNKENATEYNVSTRYTYTGYALGFGGNNEESTLTCTADMVETISLDVNHTYYRTGEASEIWDSNQVNSVYFAVPNEVLDRYGSLYEIHAEWYEYLTKEIFITSSSELYNNLVQFIGVNLSNCSEKPHFTLATAIINGERVVYNTTNPLTFEKIVDPLVYIFNANGVEGNYLLPSEQLADYIYSYDKSYNNGTIEVNNRNISADLFLTKSEFDSVYWDSAQGQATRTMGYNNVEITIEDTLKIETITQNNWWDRLWGDDKTIVEKNIAPIAIVEENILSMSDSEASDSYYISDTDISEFKEYYREQTLDDKTVFLFRFASTNYNSRALYVKNHNDLYSPSVSRYPSVFAQQSVFLDFDIIDLTFTNEGIFYVIPVVSNPIDIIPDVEVDIPEKSNNNWWTWLIIAVVVIIILIAFPLLVPVLTFLFKFLIWVIALPFKLIGWIFKSIKGGSKKK